MPPLPIELKNAISYPMRGFVKRGKLAAAIVAAHLSAEPAYAADTTAKLIEWCASGTDGFQNPKRPLNLRCGNRSSCPKADPAITVPIDGWG
jgi:hypothetical protein